ncbi:conserved hypothetical protein [Streptomyces viridosporus ATCC 14672]|uniref:YD repeat-containing protein n=2 Tax=Streptomyces viridosporus TaxID=67581 RepID=D6A5V2_STRV1|nr:conserved hypothetical protein [Streptomyces viridosporus ATCC 14672]
MYREFLTPEDEEVYQSVGEWPDSNEDGVRTLTFRDNFEQSLIFSYDALTRSVRVRWVNNHGVDMVDIYREGATRLSFTPGKSTGSIFVDFEMGEFTGVMEIKITPQLKVQDRLLFH